MDQRDDHQCDSSTPVLLELRSGESHDRPRKHGERTSTCTLHGLLRQRVLSVHDVHGAQRDGDERRNQRPDCEAVKAPLQPANRSPRSVYIANRFVPGVTRATAYASSNADADNRPWSTRSRRNAAADAAAPTCRLDARTKAPTGNDACSWLRAATLIR